MNDFLITDIKKTKKGYFSIFANGEYALSVNDEILLKYKLEIGSKIDIDKLKEINYKTNYNKCLQKSFDILSRRQHSCKEVSEKLLKYYEEDIVNEIIQKLLDINYLDDIKFCESYLSKCLNFNKYSIRKIRYDLLKKGISNDVINEVLSNLNNELDESFLVKDIVLKKYVSKLKNNEYRKVFDSIIRRGFNYEDTKKGIKLAMEELNDNV